MPIDPNIEIHAALIAELRAEVDSLKFELNHTHTRIDGVEANLPSRVTYDEVNTLIRDAAISMRAESIDEASE